MIALLIYNFLLHLLGLPLIAYLLYRRSIGKEDKGEAWGERWGKYRLNREAERAGYRIWVHAVSVGEVMAAVPILRALRQRYPDAFILLSTTTPSGREVALKQVPPADQVVYYPLDFPATVARALSDVSPNLIVLMEWEIWPNFLTLARRRGTKIAVLNGRISDKGLRRGQRGGFFTAPGLAAVDLFAMQSEEDARRAVLVGGEPAKVQVFGNTKFDESSSPLTDSERADLRAHLGLPANAPVWICGSTRDSPDTNQPDEETMIAEAFMIARQTKPDLRLILAPRHLDRAAKIIEILQAAGITVAQRSRDRQIGESACLLLDTFGELASVYAVADVAFVGGSLVRQGGQSVFQPLAQGVPALFGPYMNNQRDIAALARTEGVGWAVNDPNELAEQVLRLVWLPPNEKAALAHKARTLIERNQGVAARCVEAVATLLDRGAVA